MVSPTSRKPGLIFSTVSILALVTFLFTLPGSPFTMATTIMLHERQSPNPYFFDSSKIVGDSSKTNADSAVWMSGLPDSTAITALSIPGTHDSTARFGGDSYICQSLSLADQLSLGVRFFDIRLTLANGALSCQHGRVFQNLQFADVLQSMLDFLSANPSEAVFVKIQQEHTRYAGSDFSTAIQAELSSIPESFIFSASEAITINTIPTIAQVRGKMTIIPRFFTLPELNTIQYESMTAQDMFKVSIATKAEAIIDFYNAMLPITNLPATISAPPSESSSLTVLEARHRRHSFMMNVAVVPIGWHINYFSLHNNMESPALAAQSLNPLIANMGTSSANVRQQSSSINNSTSSTSSASPTGSFNTGSKKMGVVMMDFISTEAAQLIISSNFNV